MPPQALSQVLRHIQIDVKDPNLIVGLDIPDDAAVYRLREDLALIQTVDFFTPVVDDPYIFGQIAAANALSDIYAMGGRPVLALNIACFPNCLPLEILAEILRGGADKVAEAGATVAGGHTVEDEEPKYGLAVTGIADPARIITNASARAGDLLVLTKPLGTGIIVTGMKAGLVSTAGEQYAVDVMKTLNRNAGSAMLEAGANSCTDITGFGLLGHAAEMAEASGVSFTITASTVPVLPEVEELAAMGIIPAGAYSNRDYLADKVAFGDGISHEKKAILFDPQTSGGLLIAIPEARATALLDRLKACGHDEAAVIGRVEDRKDYLIKVIK